ncbi:MAG: 3-hydroxyacyl-CoA dehydrogenase [Rhizobiaceae bacterium]|nr:3-hydroxyacyl-CoA dehydrogenase [Rhizobiaceae bacterium]
MSSVSSIKKVCVIGAGTMGAGIAAQVANAGLEVLLLDIAGDTARNSVVDSAIERIKKSDPPLLMLSENIERIEIGNIEDDLTKVAGCDWVVEAIVERLDIKRTLYRNLLPHLKEGVLVSSNTSTIPISLLMEDMPEQLRSHFCITHFFNPVRYMRLLELVKGEDTSSEVMATLSEFCERILGKGVVECDDTPGFLGNRVGVFAMQAAIYEATRLGLRVEEADALFGRPMGIPKTGAFALYDLIGLDLMADVVRSLRSILPEGDAFHNIGAESDIINGQIANGFTGNKGKGGFYKEEGGERFSLNLQNSEWQVRSKDLPEIAKTGEVEGLSALIVGNDKLSEFAWNVLAHIFTYSASLVPDVTQSPQDIDDAMKLGYNWVHGPFEMMDILGTDMLVERMEREGWFVPEFLLAAKGHSFYAVENGQLNVRHHDGSYQPVKLPDGVVRFSMMRRTLEPVFENKGASLFHLDGGERLVEFHTKANALDADCMAVIAMAAGDPGPGIIVHNDAQHFSAGVNLEHFLALIKAQDWSGIDAFLIDFQEAVSALLYCNAPAIGAPSGLALGGGYEVLAHCDLVIAHANSVMGLVEPTVGLIPGGGGVKETYLRWYQRTGDWEKAAWNCFNQLGYSSTGTSPDMAAKLAYFEPERDRQVMNRDRLIGESRNAIKEMSGDYSPRSVPEFTLTGGDVFSAMVAFLEKGLSKGNFLPHDVMVATAVARIVTGGDESEKTGVSEKDMFRFERENFITLAKTAETKIRIESMLSGRGIVRN